MRLRTLKGAVALAAMVLVGTSACQLRLTTGIVVESDGSGVVRAGLGLDDGALAELGDPAERLRTDDLQEAGWTVSPPVREADGFTWVRIVRPFVSIEDANRVLAQLSSPDGPLRGIALEQSESLWRRTTTFRGEVDLSEGLSGLADAEVVARLGDDLGLGLGALQERFGDSLGEAIRMEVTVELPGEPHRVVVVGVGDEPQTLDAQVSRWDASVALPAIVSLLLAASALLVVWRWRHHPPGSAPEDGEAGK